MTRSSSTTYSGNIAATFEYVYDSVGNMTAFTQTVDSQTTSVIRSFDAANRLQTSTDLDAGTTNYSYDENGNLIEELGPPGIGQLRRTYTYNQRNLLVTVHVKTGVTIEGPRTEYDYDGGGNRLHQRIYGPSGVLPLPLNETITYTNDVIGLTQVMVADDGTTQIYNLFGLDLISQDSGGEVRTLLVDGLGSVRTEMVGDVVETATTYSPYGEVLAQAGTSGTVYGFTGEQKDAATGLLYLRARYYNPQLKVFQSRDPREGTSWRPGTLNYYVYGLNNPVNWIDPSGLLTCEAPQAGCAQWVQDALNAIGNTPNPIGRQLVQTLWDKDNAWTGFWFSLLSAGLSDCEIPAPVSLQTGPSSLPGFTIYFTEDFPWPVKPTDNFPAMATRPWGIYVRLSYFNPPNPPSGTALVLFAHELVHVKQGSFLAFSILGEVLAYQIQADLRRDLFPGSIRSDYETDAENIDLSDPAIRYDYDRWYQLLQDLFDWQQAHTDYSDIPFLLPIVGNPFPAPSVPISPIEAPPPTGPQPPPVGTSLPPRPVGTPLPPR